MPKLPDATVCWARYPIALIESDGILGHWRKLLAIYLGKGSGSFGLLNHDIAVEFEHVTPGGSKLVEHGRIVGFILAQELSKRQPIVANLHATLGAFARFPILAPQKKIFIPS